jgi:hypothetical protein
LQRGQPDHLVPLDSGPDFRQGRQYHSRCGRKHRGGPTGVYALNCGIGALSNSGAIGGAAGSSAAPEPSTWAMMLLGFRRIGGLGLRQRRRALAKRYGVNPKTIAKWTARKSVSDLRTGPREPGSTVLTVEESAAARRTSRPPQVEGEASRKRKFKAYPIVISISTSPRFEPVRASFISSSRSIGHRSSPSSNRTRRWPATRPRTSCAALIEAVPYRVDTVLTDNGTHFRSRRRNLVPAETNGQVERMNRAIRDATVSHFYRTRDELGARPHDFVDAYNFARRLKTLRGLTPYEFVCKAWILPPQRFTISPLEKMPGLNS